ncbi:MAG TPA: archease [Geobacteraceae bacterium]|nr:archease [Geobacteraceae bacterium]
MPYRYLEDIAIADVAFEAWGATAEEMFTAAADALMNVMVDDLSSIRRVEELDLRLEEADPEFLLFDFLNELVFYKDARRLLLRVSSLAIERHDELFFLRASLYGEEADRARHALNADVKAVTFHRFRVEETGEGWRATVVLDI